MTLSELRTAHAVLTERREELASETRSMGSPMVLRRHRSRSSQSRRDRRYRELFARMDAIQVAITDLGEVIAEHEREEQS